MTERKMRDDSNDLDGAGAAMWTLALISLACVAFVALVVWARP